MTFQPYAVWAFLLGSISGPRRMTVHMEGEESAGILEDQNVFPPAMRISTVAVTIKDKSFRVYFDRDMHKAEDEDNIYVVIRLRSNTEPVNIDFSTDMPDIMDVFEWYVTLPKDMYSPTYLSPPAWKTCEYSTMTQHPSQCVQKHLLKQIAFCPCRNGHRPFRHLTRFTRYPSPSLLCVVAICINKCE